MLVFGTRPELIKLAPLVHLIRKSCLADETIVINTGQHDQLLQDHLRYWNIQPDISFSLPDKSSLVGLLVSTLAELQKVVNDYPYLQYMIVQGDTNTALAVAQSAFLNQKRLVHIEAGLRSGNLDHPFPEEFNRIVTSRAAYFHFAPSEIARQNLLNEGVANDSIMVIGNTVIDSLRLVIEQQNKLESTVNRQVLITLHRRENISGNHLKLVRLLKKIHLQHPGLPLTWVMHPKCAVEIREELQGFPGIHLQDALPYNEFIAQYDSTLLVITDSGGVIEEATELGIPVVVYREFTERLEPIQHHYPMVVTIEEDTILDFIEKYLLEARTPSAYYGEGDASAKILKWLEYHLAEAVPDVPALTNSV